METMVETPLYRLANKASVRGMEHLGQNLNVAQARQVRELLQGVLVGIRLRRRYFNQHGLHTAVSEVDEEAVRATFVHKLGQIREKWMITDLLTNHK